MMKTEKNCCQIKMISWITQETNPVYWAYAHCLTLEPRLVSCFHHLCSKSFHFIVKSGTGKCGAGKCSRLQCCCCYVRCCCYCSWLFEKRQKTLVGVSTLIFCVVAARIGREQYFPPLGVMDLPSRQNQ